MVLIRNAPHLRLNPLLIVCFGLVATAKIFLISRGTLFPIYLNTYHGIRNVDPALVEMARSYGLSGFSLFRQVILPGALPSILVGVRFALGLDRKSTRLNSSHRYNSYAVFCLQKKK